MAEGAMGQAGRDGEVQALRRFNRFYTRRLGLLEDGRLGGGLTPTEARLIDEIADRRQPTASALAKDLALDPGHVSRTLAALERRGLVLRARSDRDARQSILALTAGGQKTFAILDARAHDAIAALLATLPAAERRQLAGACARIEALLGESGRSPEAYLVRPHRPGDMGWIIGRHAELYQQEFGWDASFEIFVAEIAVAFLKSYDAARDCCWIAERHGESVGSVCLVRVSPQIAKLRLLLVEPNARGLGIGSRLLAESLSFARRAGYAKITLWSNDSLHAARRLYERSGFRLAGEEPYRRFGKDLVGQTWECTL
jgi:DNA-binding MarR family transcriptional regulator/GNAT superfamily N-acetyltransferase